MPTETIKTNAAAKTAGGQNPPAKIADSLDGPISGPKGEKVLGEAIKNAFLNQNPLEENEEGKAGEPAPTGAPAGGEALKTGKDNLPPGNGGGEGTAADDETPEQKAEREKTELAELTARAEANGKTVDEQRALEKAELDRLTEISERTGETFEQIYEREDKGEAEPTKVGDDKTKKFTQAEVDARVEEVVKKRLKNATEKIADLEQQLSERGSRSPVQGSALDSVTDPVKLAEIRESAEARIEEADGMLRQLNYAPRKVEKFFRDLAAKTPEVAEMFKAENGDEDFSVERIAEVLEGQIRSDRTTLKAVPQREQFLAAQTKWEGIAAKVHPWLANEEDPRTVAFNNIANSPLGKALKTQVPGWRYWIGLAIPAHLRLLELAAKGKNGNGAARTPARGSGFIPRTGRGGGAAPRINGDKRTAAKEELKRTGGEKALEKFLAAAIPGVVEG